MKRTTVLASLLLAAFGGGVVAQTVEMAWPEPSQASVVFATRQVYDLARAQAFYEALGMVKVGGNEFGSAKRVFMGFDNHPRGVKVALTRANARTGPLPARESYGYIGFQVPDIAAVVAKVPAAGGKVIRAPGNAGGTQIGMVEDPDGHGVELIQRK